MSTSNRRMHQTTVRFGRDLWEALEAEAKLAGVSVAQFVREAAVARLGYAAAKRGDADWEQAMASVAPAAPPAGDADWGEDARVRAGVEIEDASALWAQGRQARLRAQELRRQRADRKR